MTDGDHGGPLGPAPGLRSKAGRAAEHSAGAGARVEGGAVPAARHPPGPGPRRPVAPSPVLSGRGAGVTADLTADLTADPTPGPTMAAPPLPTPDPTGRPADRPPGGRTPVAGDGPEQRRVVAPWWRRPAVLAWLPLTAVLTVVVVAMVLVVTAHWRRGSAVLGIAALLAGLLRAVLPTSRVGLLAVRGRVFDACFSAVTGGLLVLLAAVTE